MLHTYIYLLSGVPLCGSSLEKGLAWDQPFAIVQKSYHDTLKNNMVTIKMVLKVTFRVNGCNSFIRLSAHGALEYVVQTDSVQTRPAYHVSTLCEYWFSEGILHANRTLFEFFFLVAVCRFKLSVDG